MSVIVSLRDVVGEMEALSDEHTAYINRKTGELFTVSDEERSLVEDEELPDNLPDWQREILPKIREVLNSEDFIPLPSKFEIHEWSIMEDFCRSLQDPDQKARLLDAIHGSGAFRRFKDMIHRMGIADEWNRFRTAALEEIAIHFLESNDIPFKLDPETP